MGDSDKNGTRGGVRASKNKKLSTTQNTTKSKIHKNLRLNFHKTERASFGAPQDRVVPAIDGTNYLVNMNSTR